MKVRPGEKLGAYEVLEQIGAGGMGAVYRARDSRLGREVAIKVLPPEVAGDRDRLLRFTDEARTAGSLNHPHLVTIHEIGTHEDNPFLVEELLEGETLRTRIGRGPLSLRQAIEIAVQIARGLGAAHEKGVVHRDLKPENIFVTNEGLVKILDFGLAKNLGDTADGGATVRRSETSPGMVMGTFGYMSPEQLRGERVDHRTDLFALGIVLYEMLTGRRPFSGATTADVTAAVMREDPPEIEYPSADVGRALNRIILHALEKTPAARFQSARDFAFHLESLSQQSSAPQMAIHDERSGRRRIAQAAAWVLVALGVAVAAWWTGARMSRREIPEYQQLTFRRGSVSNARIAPDGQTVVVGAEWNGEPSGVFVKRPESHDLVDLGVPDATLLSVSRQGQLALMLRPRRRIPYCPTGTLAIMPLTGGKPREWIENVSGADWMPDGRSIVYARAIDGRFRVELRPVDAGSTVETRVLFSTATGYVIEVHASPDGQHVAFVVHPRREAIGGSVHVVKLAHGTVKKIGAATDGGIAWHPSGDEIWLNTRYTIEAWTLDARSRLVTETPARLYLHDIGSQGDLIVSHDQFAQRVACRGANQDHDRDLSWLGWSRAMDLAPDGKSVLLHEYSPRIAFGLRSLAGGAIQELGQARAHVLVPQRDAVLVNLSGDEPQLALLPLRAGETVALPKANVESINFAVVTSDAKSVIFSGDTKDGDMYLYKQDIAGGAPKRISDEPLYFGVVAVSPDSQSVAAVGPTRRITLYPLAGGQPRVLESTEPGDHPIRFADDGSLYFFRFHELPTPIYRIDLQSGETTLVRTVAPNDRAAVLFAAPRAMSGDASTYCYQYVERDSTLYRLDNTN